MYAADQFKSVVVDAEAEPELFKFIEESKVKPRFNNYSQEKLTQFKDRINELR